MFVEEDEEKTSKQERKGTKERIFPSWNPSKMDPNDSEKEICLGFSLYLLSKRSFFF